MMNPPQQEPREQLARQVTALRVDASHDADVTKEIVRFNALSRAHEGLWSRTRQEADLTDQAIAEAAKAEARREEAELGHQAVQAENPRRRARRPRQYLIAAAALAFDGVACYFAAEALGGSQPESFAWAGLFLAVLGAAEIALDYYSDGHRGLWRAIAGVLTAFIGLLGMLRFSFLATVGAEGLLTALIGAGLFTLATAGFVIIGYRALRVAETSEAWRARRRVRASAAAAEVARRRRDRQIARRDRLACAYLSRIRTHLVRTCTASQLPLMEQAVLAHLIGQDQS